MGSGFRSINVALRKELDLYACLRPCKAYEGVRTRFPETDIVIVRENHEDLYAGIEFEMGDEKTEKLRKFIAETEGTTLREDVGISIKPISIFGTQRIVREAFEYAKAYGRKKVTAGAQGQHHEAHRRPVPRGRRARSPRTSIRRSSSRTGSSTTSATSSCRVPRSTTWWCCRTSTATSCPTSARA